VRSRIRRLPGSPAQALLAETKPKRRWVKLTENRDKTWSVTWLPPTRRRCPSVMRHASITSQTGESTREMAEGRLMRDLSWCVSGSRSDPTPSASSSRGSPQ
jgi:hypothetical protein